MSRRGLLSFAAALLLVSTSATSCVDGPFPAVDPPPPEPHPSCYGSVDSCSCNLTYDGALSVCSGDLCCAPAGWPTTASGGQCSCQAAKIVCVNDPDYNQCSCRVNGTAVAGEEVVAACPPSPTVSCQEDSDGSCFSAYGPTLCGAGLTQVDACPAPTLPTCIDGTTKVDSCAP